MDDQCKCHILKEKCKLYDYQSASEIICQACLNQPIITVVTRKFQISRGNSPAAEAAVPAAARKTSSSSLTPELLITRLQQQQQQLHQQHQSPLSASQLTQDVGKSSSRPLIVFSDGRNNDHATDSPRLLRSSKDTTTATHSTKSSTPSTKASVIDKLSITTANRPAADCVQSGVTPNTELIGSASREGGSGRLASTKENRARNGSSRRAAAEKATKLRRPASAGSHDSTTSWLTTALTSDTLRLASRCEPHDARLSNSNSSGTGGVSGGSSGSDISEDTDSSDSSDEQAGSRVCPARAEATAAPSASHSVWRHRKRRLPRRRWGRPTATNRTRQTMLKPVDPGSRHHHHDGRPRKCSGSSPTSHYHQRQYQDKHQHQHQPSHKSSAASSDGHNSEEASVPWLASGKMRGNQMDRSSESQTPESILRELMSNGKVLDATGMQSPRHTPRSSEIRLSKQEPLSLVEKTIMDFFNTHKGDSAPRVVPAQGDDKWPGGAKSGGPFRRDLHQTAVQISCGYLLKDAIVIGSQGVFEQFVSREFILPMFDSLLDAFLTDSSTLRAACSQTRCRVELSRRILNRRVMHGSWVKYMVVTISGPTMGSIDNCDRLLKKYLQAYRLRRVHDRETTCCLFFREEIPDNANLCFGHQRTGFATTRYGNLKLQSTFSCAHKGGSCSKQGLTKYGRAALSSRQSKNCIKFVYSNAFQNRTDCVPTYCTGVAAIGKRQLMQDEAVETRHAVVEQRKKMLLPLFRV